ncbi:MAG: glycosyltransferase family 9 protein [Atribacterota bacterium]
MRQKIKDILKIFKLNRVIRYLRKIFYFLFDFIGDILFLRFLKKQKKIEKKNIKKILVIRLDRIGDLILTIPAIRAIRETYPGADIDLLIKEYTLPLVKNNPDIDKIIIYKKQDLKKEYDLAIAFHPGIKENYLTYKSGAQHRIGYKGEGGSFFLTKRLKDDRKKRIRHEVESALEIANVAGCKTDKKKLELNVDEKAKEFANKFFSKNKLTGKYPVVLVHPGARQRYIKWDKEKFARVSDKLIDERNASVIILGGPNEKRLVNEVSEIMARKPVKAVDLDLNKVISITKKCDLFIGNSTGPMHIAAGLGVPVVAVFGSRHPLDSAEEWGPWSENSVVVNKDPGCRRCHPGDCSDYKCMKQVTVKDVYKQCIKLLSNE